jgi:hypothetical protein
MRKKSASGVLVSLRGSTYGLGETSVSIGDGWAGEKRYDSPPFLSSMMGHGHHATTEIFVEEEQQLLDRAEQPHRTGNEMIIPPITS